MVATKWYVAPGRKGLTAAVLEEFVRFAVTPVLVDQRAESQILHTGAAGIEKGGHAAGFG